MTEPRRNTPEERARLREERRPRVLYDYFQAVHSCGHTQMHSLPVPYNQRLTALKGLKLRPCDVCTKEIVAKQKLSSDPQPKQSDSQDSAG